MGPLVAVVCVFLFSFSKIIAQDQQRQWWLTGNPFHRHTTTPLPLLWHDSEHEVIRPCQCSSPERCMDYVFLKAGVDRFRCPRQGEVCCQALSPAESYNANSEENDMNNSLAPGGYPGDNSQYANYPNIDDEDVAGDISASSSHKVTTVTPPPSDQSVYDLEDTEGSGGPEMEYSCGVSTPQLFIDEKVNTGHNPNANFGEFPWTLMILYQEDPDLFAPIICGASLIEERFAVTAAHCVEGKDPRRLTVRAGEWDTENENENYRYQNSSVQQVFIHSGYRKLGLHHDIALIFLSDTIKQAPHINKICLPEENEKFMDPCLATGWGNRGHHEFSSDQSKMKRVQVNLMKAKDCDREMRKTDLGNSFSLSSTSLCARRVKSDEDTQMGDGGGPLFCKSTLFPKHFSLIGVTSWGKKNYPGTPGVYTSVRKYRDWLNNSMMKALGL